MKNKKWLHGITVLVIIGFGLLAIGSAASTKPLVYDASIPEAEQSVLTVHSPYMTITKFDGADVKWKTNSRISIPAGKHTLQISYSETVYTGRTGYADGSSADTYTKYSDESSHEYDFLPCRIYAFNVERNGLLLQYLPDNIGVTELAVPGENESLLIFTRKGMVVHKESFYVDGKYSLLIDPSKNNEGRMILPKGKHSIAAKLELSKIGEPVEIDVQEDEIHINVNTKLSVIPPTLEIVSSGGK